MCKRHKKESLQKTSSLTIAYDKLDQLITDTGKIDNQVSEKISNREDDFYKEYSYLKPDCKKSKKERRHEKWAEMRQNFKEFCGGVIGAIANIVKDVVDWAKENWKEILITIAIVVGAIVAIVAVIASGGLALMPFLMGLGLSASAAAGISTAVGVVAVISTIGSSILNLFDTWCGINNSSLKTLQKVLNWTSLISNGVYSIGAMYNGFKHISNTAIKELNGNRLVNVTRWGRSGLQSGDWVMKGNNTWYNYIRSFKWDFISPSNTVAPKSIGETFLVPLKTLHRPTGFGVDGIWKSIFG